MKKSRRRLNNAPDKEQLLAYLEQMELIRLTETRLGALFADGEIPGFIHLSVGQEAVAVGILAALGPHDTVASNHRGHGHAIARGVDLNRLVLEIMAKEEGYCGGRGGSMHVADASIGMLGANGIVGAGVPIAVGSALALQHRKTGGLAAVFFGDGAIAEGVLHESLNLAALWRLPVLFVCENNGWSEFSPSSRQLAVKTSAFASAYGIPYLHADGNDVVAVATAAREAVAHIRSGEGPFFLECKTHRVRGHFEGDPQKYRDTVDGEIGLADNDPIMRIRNELESLGVEVRELDEMSERVAGRVEEAVVIGRGGRDPDFAAASADVYAS